MFKLKLSKSGFFKTPPRSQIHSVPRGAILSFCSDNDWGGIQIDRMPELTTLAVRTANSLYEITILDGSAGDVLVRGGPYFPERTPVTLQLVRWLVSEVALDQPRYAAGVCPATRGALHRDRL
jgi:hypothetical protein